MCALSCSTGIAIRVEVPVEDGAKHGHDGVMNDTVAVRGSGDEPGFGPGDAMGAERSWSVVTGFQFALEADQFPLALELEAGDNGASKFAAASIPGGDEQVRP